MNRAIATVRFDEINKKKIPYTGNDHKWPVHERRLQFKISIILLIEYFVVRYITVKVNVNRHVQTKKSTIKLIWLFWKFLFLPYIHSSFYSMFGKNKTLNEKSSKKISKTISNTCEVRYGICFMVPQTNREIFPLKHFFCYFKICREKNTLILFIH